MNTHVACLALAALLAIPAFAAAGATFDLSPKAGEALNAAATPISEEDEIAQGRQLAGQLLGASPLTDDPALQHYVNRIGRWIASQSERPDLPWRFGVIDTRALNAYSAPGGYVFVGRGLYEILDNEAQLAGVLGHAIASVARRQHVTIVQKSAMVSAMAAMPSMIAGPRGGAASAVRQQMSGLITDVLIRGTERAAVYEADHVGLVLAARAGYNPQALVEVLVKLHMRRSDPPSVNQMLSTHPLPAERLQELETAITPLASSLPAGAEPPLRPVSALCYFPCRPTLK